ncbi:MAG: LuxR C-terminal-related transcriptional regulator [Nitrospirota bacterium]
MINVILGIIFRKMANNNHKAARIKNCIKNLESIIGKEPIMFISHNGDVWISEKASKKLLEKKINTDEMLGWLKIGVRHLTEASFCGLNTLMVQLPKNPQGADVLVILRDKQSKEISILTIMEKKVLKYLVRGFSNKKIALSLTIGAGTVNAHLDNIYRKFDVSSRSAAICTAIKLGIVVPQI